MKLLICSDIHGDAESTRRILEIYERARCERLLILGDILYHGPRNDPPAGYAPKEVISLLNPMKDEIIAVRGNCDAEVDQMVLDFPITSELAYLFVDGLGIVATHGHKYDASNPPPLKKGEILLHGHTHIVKCEKFGDSNFCLNPGSVSLPKGGCPKSYILYSDRAFTALDFDGNTIFEKKF